MLPWVVVVVSCGATGAVVVVVVVAVVVVVVAVVARGVHTTTSSYYYLISLSATTYDTIEVPITARGGRRRKYWRGRGNANILTTFLVVALKTQAILVNEPLRLSQNTPSV